MVYCPDHSFCVCLIKPFLLTLRKVAFFLSRNLELSLLMDRVFWLIKNLYFRKHLPLKIQLRGAVTRCCSSRWFQLSFETREHSNWFLTKLEKNDNRNWKAIIKKREIIWREISIQWVLLICAGDTCAFVVSILKWIRNGTHRNSCLTAYKANWF